MASVQTAAEKRAARRARVLQGGESRLNRLKGQYSSPQLPPDTDETSTLEQQLDESVDELVASGSEPADPSTELRIPPRVDPAQRRRQAATRRRRNEQLVQTILANKPRVDEETVVDQGIFQQLPSTLPASCTPTHSTRSRHSTALKLYVLEERLVCVLIVAAAVYSAGCMNLQSIAASLAAEDPVFGSYQDLIDKDVPLDSIRRRFEREQVEPEMRQKLEQFMTQQVEMEAMSQTTSGRSGWLPDGAGFQFLFTSLVAHPPIVLCVLLVRMLVSRSMKALHSALNLPDVKDSDEGNLGFLMNMVLSSQPVLKEFLVEGRKSLDDVFFFIFALVVSVAIRCIWLSYDHMY